MNKSSRSATGASRSTREETVHSSPRMEAGGACTGETGRKYLAFSKMQALGNDFVIVSDAALASAVTQSNAFESWQAGQAELARVLCDRHFGIGADGLIVAKPTDRADCQLSWQYINSDGSPARMCGNGLRCLALWAVLNEWVSSLEFSVSTQIGPVPVRFDSADQITIDLGVPILESGGIPVSGQQRSPVLREALNVSGMTLYFTGVSMGNPHCVVFNPSLDCKDYERVANEIQSLPLFPEGVNVEFAKIESRGHVRVEVWERGCGRTLACATGAAATLVAGVLEEHLDRKARIDLPGGSLVVEWSELDNRVRLSGPARMTFSGSVDLAALLTEGAQQ